jgi:long-chain fatty acid transport protein
MQLLVPITVGYRINENHSVGVALDLAVQRFRMYGLQSFVAFGTSFRVPISADPAHLTNQGFDYSYGAGVKLGYLGSFFDDQLSAGISYTSRTYMTKFDQYRGLFAQQGDFDIPANYGIGIAFKPRKNLVIAADINKIEWSSIAALGNRGPETSKTPYPGSLNNPNGSNAINGIPSAAPGGAIYVTGNDQGMGFGWEDQMVYKIGVNWGVNNRLQLRAGYNYGSTPIPDDQLTFNTLLPVTTEKHYSVGFTYKATDELEITGTYMRAPESSQQSPNFRQNVVGTVDIGMHQQLFALSLGWILDPGASNYGEDAMDPISFAGWYFGFGVGQDTGKDWNAARFTSSYAAQGVTGIQTSADNSDVGYKVFAGYQFNQYFALEGGFSLLGNYTANGTGSTPATGALYQTVDNNTWTFAAVGTLPVTKNFAVFGKLGANFWDSYTTTYITDTAECGNGRCSSTRTWDTDRGTDPYYGVGASYALMDNVDVRGEYERYDFGGSNIDFLSAGLAVKF